jgi:hypothetical protein
MRKNCLYDFEIVTDYTYLGTIIANINKLKPEIKKNYKSKYSTSSSAEK